MRCIQTNRNVSRGKVLMVTKESMGWSEEETSEKNTNRSQQGFVSQQKTN